MRRKGRRKPANPYSPLEPSSTPFETADERLLRIRKALWAFDRRPPAVDYAKPIRIRIPSLKRDGDALDHRLPGSFENGKRRSGRAATAASLADCRRGSADRRRRHRLQHARTGPLRQASGIEPESSGVHVLLGGHGVRSMQRLALADVDGGLIAALWPAELKPAPSIEHDRRTAHLGRR